MQAAHNSFRKCDTCGRTILQGERAWQYLTPEGESRLICELCRPEAERAGWRRADLSAEHRPASPARVRSGRRPVRAWLRGLRSGSRSAEGAAPEAGGERAQGEPIELAPEPAPAGPEGRSRREVGGVRTLPANPQSRLRAALERFNRSEHTRTVAGLTRTLGAPSVSAGAAAGTPGEIRLTVAWELSWYQWAVDLTDESAAVRVLQKGTEIGELDGPAREWNARADEQGHLHMAGEGD